LWLDPAISLVISVVVIVMGTWSLLRDSVNFALAAVPEGIDRESVAGYLGSLPGITTVDDLHIWGMSTTETALTAHSWSCSPLPLAAVLAQPTTNVSTLPVRTASEMVLRRAHDEW
jgi:Co/Zn/Cd efflux system component